MIWEKINSSEFDLKNLEKFSFRLQTTFQWNENQNNSTLTNKQYLTVKYNFDIHTCPFIWYS